MIELHIQNYDDREKMIMSLVNSGYMVKVVEKLDPSNQLSKLYYVKFTNDSINKKYAKVKELFEYSVKQTRRYRDDDRVYYRGFTKGIKEIVEILMPELELEVRNSLE